MKLKVFLIQLLLMAVFLWAVSTDWKHGQHDAIQNPVALVRPRAVLACFRTEITERDWRCASCNKMQHAGTTLYWVPDRVLPGDPIWSIENACKGHNGSGSGWCKDCAPKKEL